MKQFHIVFPDSSFAGKLMIFFPTDESSLPPKLSAWVENPCYKGVANGRFLPARVICIGLLICAGQTPAAAATSSEVAAAIEKAKASLYAMQKEGNWEEVQAPENDFKDINGGQWSGMTALATYALLCAGEKATDPPIAAAIDFLTRTETHGIYAAGTRCLVWSSIEQTPKVKAAAKKDVDLLLSAIRKQGPAKGLYYYNAPIDRHDEAYDHSVSQFAPLGLWAMARRGYVEIPSGYWNETDQAWRNHQYADGSWSYVYNDPGGWGKHTASMTAAGVATLLITDEWLSPGVECKGNKQDQNIAKGLEWLGKNFEAVFDTSQQLSGWRYQNYTLFGISRVGATGGYKYFGTIDWYQRGSDYLLRGQQPDGSWEGAKPRAAETALAMLFLEYGGAPVVLNKLEYSLQTGNAKTATAAHWDQRPQDAPNFVQWMGRELERRLNWQIVNLAVPVEDLHEAPILYITGDQALSLSQQDRNKLRQFVEQGGMILGNADCGSPAFMKGFEKLGTELFPGYVFRDLPEAHVIFTNEEYRATKWKTKPRIRGLSNGVRELMLLPALDLSRAFQARGEVSRADLYQLTEDIVLYAMDKKGLVAKGESYILKVDSAVPTGRPIALARLEVGQNWDPEPGGWRRLAALLHNHFKIELAIESIKLGEGKLSSFHGIAHLTGTASFILNDSQRDELRKFIEGGGTLIIDAAGGSQEFASSAEKELAVLFGSGAGKLAPLPPDNAVYAMPEAKIDSVGYRSFARARLVGALKAPSVCGIEQKGRLVAFYSREDLSAGMVGEPVDGILGYDPASATAIMRNLILYAAAGRGPTSAAATNLATGRSPSE